MELLPRHTDDFGSKQYWEAFFDRVKDFEWYGEWPALRALVRRRAPAASRVLVAGCGNSSLSAALWRDGYRRALSVDFSPSVIAEMKAKYADIIEEAKVRRRRRRAPPRCRWARVRCADAARRPTPPPSSTSSRWT